MKSETLGVYTDGGSRGNPGPAAIAYRIYNSSGKIIEQDGYFIGNQTNNFAEYTALIVALRTASKHSHGEVKCFSDSKLVVDQLNEDAKVNKPHLKKLFREVKEMEKRFQKATYSHLGRGHTIISEMDKLVNKVLDREGK